MHFSSGIRPSPSGAMGSLRQMICHNPSFVFVAVRRSLSSTESAL